MDQIRTERRNTKITVASFYAAGEQGASLKPVAN